ncbi:hypothetical protein [Paenibacillus mendelii]|uniref:Uncharacterized protein n=1 Tax=Paenibacillus mendelii TaxID=206163 RepID=A0ABV6JF71_9BACL|nr:hypothetical protein [Paenibacillus mendelii]MCQ6557438.1 hypothetical protein [Paenibacillus mendelii]
MDKWNTKWLKVATYLLLVFSVVFFASGQVVSAGCLMFSSVMLFLSLQLVEIDRMRKARAASKL